MCRTLLACVLLGADAASAQATNHRVESISPASITISGFPCRSDKIDQVYSLQAQGDDRPAYLSIATRAVLWYGDAEGVGEPPPASSSCPSLFLLLLPFCALCVLLSWCSSDALACRPLVH